jgi:para-aminobenzoate synthetase component 1
MGPLATSAALVVPLAGSVSPLEALARFSDLPFPCLLHSASATHELSRYSYLAADPVSRLHGSARSWPEVRRIVRATLSTNATPVAGLPPFQGGWLGWFGYELGTAFDSVPRHRRPAVDAPDVSLGLYDWIIAWDHLEGLAWLISTGVDATGASNPATARRRADSVVARWQTRAAPNPHRAATRGEPQSDFTAAEYQMTVARAVEYVLAGDIFEVNLAQRFSAAFDGDVLSLYRAVVDRTGAPMSAFIQHAGVCVLSGSPERFVRYEPATQRLETRPIKGTRPRHSDADRDAELAAELLASEKDRAENVMIVDLLRNDLSRVCNAGSVRVPVLCALESHPTVHHLVSVVTGTVKPGRDALDLLEATFPGGSITGAPKIRAMEVIAELEPVARGIYSGCIGWIGLDGAMDTSIAIRTIVLANGMAAWHAGGAITADSTPKGEYDETLDKARALAAAVAAVAAA